MRFCVCVPARNEAERLPALLDALAAQDVGGVVPVSICINNSDDDSAGRVDVARAKYRDRLAIASDVCILAADRAHVGTARGRAMAAGAELAGAGGVLLTTDADCRPPVNWVSANLAAFDRGADIVGGRIEIDPAEPVSAVVSKARARLDAYWAAVRAIEDAIDPQPHDPPPRHGDHTGASLAIRVALYRRAGGVPPLAHGEDRALVAAAVAAGGRLVHPIDVWTRTSARTVGRAPGGMAVAMADLHALLARGEEPQVPALDHWRARAAWRAAARREGRHDLALREAELPAMPCDRRLSEPA